LLRHLTRIKYVRTLVTELTYWPLLFRELRKADVVHVFAAAYFSFLLAPLPAVLIARLLGKPVLLNYHSGEAPDHLRRSAVARAILKHVDATVVQSRFLHDIFASFAIPSTIIPNNVDTEQFQFRRRETIRPRIVSTRSFESLYNVSCTLRAFRLIQDRYPDATLTLVGGGSEESALRQLSEHLALQHVTFAGRISPENIWRCYADADIFLQTPEIDNMPCSVLEAFASGCAVVSTRAGGVPTILSDQVHGLLVPLSDHAAAAAAVLRLLEEPGLATTLTRAAFATCAGYEWSSVRRQWLDLYRSVAAAPGVPAPKLA
jgi:glycosyltransferase involved in cell wall biosynthesis